MINNIIFFIKQDYKLYNYLKYHSYLYEILYYNEDKIKDMIKEMKHEYKETIEDKLIDFKKKIEFLSSVIDLVS